MEKIIISCLESRVETNRSIYARFLLGPFKDDQAVTIATALRRSLLSKVKSIAITAIHIQGVTHEFSTIVGVRESVLDLALNFQQVVLRTQTKKQKKIFNAYKSITRPRKGKENFVSLYEQNLNLKMKTKPEQNSVLFNKAPASVKQKVQARSTLGLEQPLNSDKAFPHITSETAQIGYLQVQGPAIIYANDLKLPVGVECVDPTQYIATLSTEGLLVVKFIIDVDLNKTTFCYTSASQKKAPFDNNNEKLIGSFSPDKQNGYQNTAPIPLLPKQNSGITKFITFSQSEQAKLRYPESNLKNIRSILETTPVVNDNIEAPLRYSHKLQSFVQRSSLLHSGLRNTIFLDPSFDSVFQVNYVIEKDDLFNQPRNELF